MPWPAAAAGAGARPARRRRAERPKAAASSQQHAVEQPGDARRRLVLHEVEQGRDQREARHQEKHRGNEAHRVGEREVADAEAAARSGSRRPTASTAQSAVMAILVEPCATAACARPGPGRRPHGRGRGCQHVAAVQVGEAGRGDRHRQGDRHERMERRGRLDGVDRGGQRLPASGRACSSAPAAPAPPMREALMPSGATSRASVTCSPPACAVAVMPPRVMCTASRSMPRLPASRPMASRTRKAVSPDRSIAAPKRSRTSRDSARGTFCSGMAGGAPLQWRVFS